MDLSSEIRELKEEKNAVILAHNYQISEIQDVADLTGDSLELSRKASETDAEIIVFAGVDFMAQTAKVLSPEKTVLMPSREARCPMACMLEKDDILKAKQQYPDADVVLYVNTLAEHKALADCVCTSANADRVVNAMDSETVVFGPDMNLAYYVEKRTQKKLIRIPEKGYCHAHTHMSLEDLQRAKQQHPEALVVVHPECIPKIQEKADHIASTSGMLKYCRQSPEKEFIIGTETGMLYPLQKQMPGKKFYPLADTAICSDMKKNTMEGIMNALKTGQHEVMLPEEIVTKSQKAIRRMLEL